MAESYFKRIDPDAGVKEIVEYLDYLALRLQENFETIDDENMTEDFLKRTGGNYNGYKGN